MINICGVYEKKEESICNVLTIIIFFIYYLSELYKSTVLGYFWYVAIALCIIVGVLSDIKYIRSKKIYFFGVLVFLTGILNHFFIGNLSLRQDVILVLYIAVALFFLNRKTNPNVYLIIFFLLAILSLVKILTNGYENLYFASSENYVSVFFLLPISLYYVKCDENGKEPFCFPIFIYLLLCFISRGRGGILTGCLFVILFVTYQAIHKKRHGTKNELKNYLFLVFIYAFVVFILTYASNKLLILVDPKNAVLYHFVRSGFGSESRIQIWVSYFTEAIKSLKTILLGARNDVGLVGEFKGNTHNSFIQIHMYNGIFTFIMVLLLLLNTLLYSLKNRKFLIAISMCCFCCRAFLDEMAWMPRSTSVFIVFLILPMVLSKLEGKKE